MSVMGSWRLLNAIENKSIDGAALEVLVSSEPRRYNELAALIGTRAMMQRVVSVRDSINTLLTSPTALAALLANRDAVSIVSNSYIGMTEVSESPAAMEQIAGDPGLFNIIVASGNGMAVVANSEAAMQVVAGSPIAMDRLVANPIALGTVLSSSIGRLGFWSDDVALNILFNSVEVFATLRSLGTIYHRSSDGGYAVSWDSGVTPENLDSQGKYLFMGASWQSTQNRTLTIGTRRSNSVMPDSGFLGTISSLDADSWLSLCPIEGPHTTQLNSTGSAPTYISLLRCD